MAKNHDNSTPNYSDESNYLAQQRRDIAYEKWQENRIKELAEQIAEECPNMWGRGDGKGGMIFNEISAAYTSKNLKIGQK